MNWLKKMMCMLLAAILTAAMAIPIAAEDERLLPTSGKEIVAQKEAQDAEPQRELMPEEQLLNMVDKLVPVLPQSPQLAALVEQLVDEVTGEEMTQGEKLRASFDYLVQNISYGSHMAYMGTPLADTTCRQIYAQYGEIEGFGAVALTAQKGMCNAYAAAFIMMARSIGFDAQLVRGWTKSKNGGFTYHEWAQINVNGQAYIFDPQLEQDLVASGLEAYSVFGKTYAQVGSRYKRK